MRKRTLQGYIHFESSGNFVVIYTSKESISQFVVCYLAIVNGNCSSRSIKIISSIIRVLCPECKTISLALYQYYFNASLCCSVSISFELTFRNSHIQKRKIHTVFIIHCKFQLIDTIGIITYRSRLYVISQLGSESDFHFITCTLGDYFFLGATGCKKQTCHCKQS